MLIVVISGDKGFAGAFNANITKTAFQFIDGNTDKEIDIEAIGRKGRDLLRRRYPLQLTARRPMRTATSARSAMSARATSRSRAIIRECC